ncbi:MAG: hypothetical protein QCH35_02325 [Methanomicrobiaceae archaeon]|nr:hypothetical protein [Methanomicrobiaceae archaeon]
MDLHDALTLVGAILIVALFSVFYSPVSPDDVQAPRPTVTPTPETHNTPATPTPAPPAPSIHDPVRITYTRNYLSYPVHILPSNMNVFGASDPDWQWRFKEMVAFAFLEESVGGLTETFSVPYPVWRVNSTLTATTTPQYALLQWVLVDATTGEILEGGELRHGGSMTKTVQVSCTAMYFIVHTRSADGITLSLETMADHLSP